jgi:DNA polymerase I-like protein with 3'-5' exonuclease and polymerase domains
VTELSALVREKMENAITLQVPLSVELNTGPTWLDVH